MGLIQAALNAAGTVLGDQWKEYFYCEAIDNNTLVVKGQKKVSGFSSNRRGADNIITNGSVVAVADGQCMIIVDNGKIAELCAVPAAGSEGTGIAATLPRLRLPRLKTP